MFGALVLASVLALQSVGESVIESEICSATTDPFGDCGLYDAPSRKDRVCKFHDSDGYHSLEWYTGTLDSERCTLTGRSTSRDGSLDYCPGYVGMNMTLWCDFVNVTSVIYKDGMPFSEESAVTFNELRKEHEGLYQCRRNDSLELIEEFNMTVRNEVHIGGANTQGCIPFYCKTSPSSKRKCCYYNGWNPSSIGERRRNAPVSVSVYGDAPINYTLSVEWDTDRTDHYPTDLGQYFTISSTDPTVVEVNFNDYPHNVNGKTLQAVIILTASNNFSSFTTCFAIRFINSDIYNANTSLPHDVNTTAGGNATFFCDFGSNRNTFTSVPELRFNVTTPGKDGRLNATSTTVCKDWEFCSEWSHTLPSTRLSIKPTNKVNQANYVLYHYEVRLTNIVQELDGTQFSCSIITQPEDLIQWEGTANLMIVKSDLETVVTTELPEDSKVSNIDREAITAVTVSLIVVLLVLVVIVAVLVVVFMKWQRKHREPCELAEIPLTSLSHPTVSQSTVSSDPGTPVTIDQYRLPSISIMEVGGIHRDVIVGREALQETRSMDSGVSCTEDYDHVRRPPNTLRMTRAQQRKELESTSPVRLCRSETDIADSPSMASVRTPRKKSVIYVSYTDHISRWVRTTLKPLIDSWNIAEVMLPERDMVAGKAISNERRRLIVEADKIIVVISPDYYDSDWCSYELMHAIQNEPTLSRGRIVPILIDGCKHLPKNMEVVVPLFAHEQDFSQRLFAAIYPQPRLSLQ